MGSAELRTEIDNLIKDLEASWEGTDAFSAAQRDYLLRRCEVAYVGQSSSVKANAAGGKYRGRVGRALFRTEALFQHVLEDGVAVNMIQFSLLNLVKGCAVLPGEWSRPSAEALQVLQKQAAQRMQSRTDAATSPRLLTGNTISVRFDAPRLAFGPGAGLLNLKFGPSSDVALDTTYLDNTLRICRGATSGTPFVFRADSCADGAPLAEASRQWQLVVAKPPLGKPPIVAALLSAALAAWTLGRRGTPATVAAAALVAGAVAVARSTGGIVVERNQKAKQEVFDAPTGTGQDAGSRGASAPAAAPAAAPATAASSKWVAQAQRTIEERATSAAAAATATKAKVITAASAAATATTSAARSVAPSQWTREPTMWKREQPEVAEAPAPSAPAPAPRTSRAVKKVAAADLKFGPPPEGFSWGGIY